VQFGVLTGVGDCLGLNAVIRAAVRKGIRQYGHGFVGFHDGWRGVLECDAEELTLDSTQGILDRGTPTAFDRVLATRLGLAAIDAAHEGRWGMMPALRGTRIKLEPLADAVAELRSVPVEDCEAFSALLG
jgi:6-phosphofructokinase